MPVPTDTSPIDRSSARHAVLEHLRAWIEDGRFAPGEVIKDSEIAATLGVSRTPVREALQMLERDGFVEMLPGRLTRVTAITPEDVRLLYAPIAALQGLAAEIGAARASTGDVAAMRAHNERLLAALKAGDPVAARDADREFHAALVALADNPYLSSAVEPLLMHARRLETLYFSDQEPGMQSYREHQQIIDAVRAGDTETAGRLTRHNFGRFWTPAPGQQAQEPSA